MALYPVYNESIGKKTHANPMSQPKGSCRLLENWDTSRDSIYRIPRGRDTYSNDASLPASTVEVPMKYQGHLYLHYANNTIYYDTAVAGTFAQMQDQAAGTSFTPPTGYSMDWLENNNNLYITTNIGLLKCDTYTGNFMNAGCPKGLSSDIRLTTPVAGTWLVNNNYVAYRHVWSYTDANNKKIVGAPSDRQEVQNTTGVTVAVEHRIYIPDDVTTDHLLELYRTTDGAASQPENEQLVYQENPSAADIAAGYMLIDDITPADFRGAYLYTNTTQEGISQANELPPLARTLDKYKNYVIYANINNLHRLYTALVSVTNLTAGVSTLTFTDGTSPFTMGCYAPNAGDVVTGAADNGAGLIRITIGAGHTMATGDWVRIYDVTGTTEANGIWEITVIDANNYDLVGSAFSNAYVAGGTSDRYEDLGATPRFILYTALGTTALNIDATCRSIIRCINQCAPNTYLYGYVVSNADDPPGKMMFTNRTLRDVAFSITANSAATGACFSPIIPTAGTDYVSTNDTLQNAFMWSKANEQEAVPLVNIGYVGSSNDPIIKVIGLRDSVFFIKENDGIYQMTGEAAPFNVDEFDGTVRCLQPDSIAKGQNAIFMMSNLGYVKISNSGVEVIGRDNEYQDLKPILNTDYDLYGFGWFYEDEKCYKVATMTDEDSTNKDIVKIYNTFNGSWRDEVHGVTTGDVDVGCGIVVNSIEYTFGVTGRTVYQERKSFTATDHATPDITNAITAIDPTTNTVTLNAANTVPVESILSQTTGPNTYSKVIIEITDTTHFVLNNVNNLNVAACTIIPGIESELEYNPIHGGSPFIEKFIRQVVLQFDGEETSIENILIELRSDKDPTPIEISMVELPTNYWGLSWSGIWGTYNEVDKFLTWATQEHSEGSVFYLKVKHRAARKQVALSGFAMDFEGISEGRNKDR